MRDKTERLGLRFLHQYQSKKEILVNENFAKLDAMFNRGALSHSQIAPPSTPLFGALYIIPESATGVWANYKDHIAIFLDTWEYIPASEGMMYWVNDEEKIVIFTQSKWKQIICSKEDETNKGV